ncbi:MAG: glycosyltransferase [Acidimicrobiales bacterium]
MNVYVPSWRHRWPSRGRHHGLRAPLGPRPGRHRRARVPGERVDAGPPQLAGAPGGRRRLHRRGRRPAARASSAMLHANLWLSGVAGHRLKHQLDLPLVSTFHTLARVKADTGDPEPQRRIDAEAEVVGCSGVVLASSLEEVAQLRRTTGPTRRIEVVPPGSSTPSSRPATVAALRRARPGRPPSPACARRISR